MFLPVEFSKHDKAGLLRFKLPRLKLKAGLIDVPDIGFDISLYNQAEYGFISTVIFPPCIVFFD